MEIPAARRRRIQMGLIREYIYLSGAVSPKGGTPVHLIMPASNTACFRAFLDALSRKFARQVILLAQDGAPNDRSSDLVLPTNIPALFLEPYAPELNPRENLWDEIGAKIIRNHARKSIGAARATLRRTNLSNKPNPETVKSIASLPSIVRSLRYGNCIKVRRARLARFFGVARKTRSGPHLGRPRSKAWRPAPVLAGSRSGRKMQAMPAARISLSRRARQQARVRAVFRHP